MGLKPVSSYRIDGDWAGNGGVIVRDRLKTKWYVVSERTALSYVNGRLMSTWIIKRYLQVRVESGNGVTRVETSVTLNGSSKSIYSTSKMNTSGGDTGESFNQIGSWMTAYLKMDSQSDPNAGVRDGYCYSYETVYETGDVNSKSKQSTSVKLTPATNQYTYPDIPVYEYGGIIPAQPRVVNSYSYDKTQTSAAISIEVESPYDFSYTVKVLPRGGTEQTYAGTGQITSRDYGNYGHTDVTVEVEGLSPNTLCTYNIYITCENQRTGGGNGEFKTLPIYVTTISCASDLYVNENEVITLTPTYSPNDASVKEAFYFSDTSNPKKFNISYPDSPQEYQSIVGGSSVKITGSIASEESATLQVRSRDGGTASTNVNIHVCRPASAISTIERRRVSPGSTYQLSYSISPAGSTDHTVTFSSSDTSVATVNSSGVVTGVSAGESTVTLTCSKRVIDEHGIVTGSTTISTTITISVSSDPEWYQEYVDSPHYQITDEHIDCMFDNLSVLRSCLNGYSYEYEGQTVTINIPSFTAPQTNGQFTPIYMVQSCINEIESAIDKIHDATKNIDDYWIETANEAYDASVTWSGEITDGSDRMDRWYIFLQSIWLFCVQENIFPNEVTA